MCGIVAVVSANTADLGPISVMNETLRHRGPDDSGCEEHPESGVALAMRRLSIVDLADGHQPMWDASGQIAVVFNGEIYNHRELREELESLGYTFRSDHSDTEVLVTGYRAWGTDLFARLNGMFALVLWERGRNELVVARDRMGQKPLYIARVAGGYLIASELKAIVAHPAYSPELDLEGLEQFLGFDFILAPRTMLKGVQKFPAAHHGVVSPEGVSQTRYWRMSLQPDEETSDEEHRDRFDEQLDAAVRRRIVADVPVGLFLSGGLDSSAIGYYMRRYSSDVRSFSISFEDEEFDESSYGRLVAQHLGTRHEVEQLSPTRMLDLVPRMPEILDEPMGNPSIFPTYLLSEFTRQHVTVALGGDGSDELLMGYKAYNVMQGLWTLDRAPTPLRRWASSAARAVLGPPRAPWSRSRWLVQQADIAPEQHLLSYLGSFRGDPRWVFTAEVRSQLSTRSLLASVNGFGSHFDGIRTAGNRTIASYAEGYLQEDILSKVDRASMAASLEVRSPFLDPEVVAAAGRMPQRLKLRGRTRKDVLRRLMRGRLPDQIIDRPKQGFGIPLGPWLRGPLRPLVETYLNSGRLRQDGLFDPAAVRRLLDEHQAQGANHGNAIWALLQFQLWQDRWLRGQSVHG